MKTSVILFLSILFVTSSCFKDRKIDKAGLRMQNFIQNISAYARACKSDFIVIPQNGVELAFKDIKSENGLNTTFLEAIDGFGIEELFYNGAEVEDDGRLSMARSIRESKQILVADYTNNGDGYNQSKIKNSNENFLAFTRSENNYDYELIPSDIMNENANNVNTLGEAKNYLYLISTGQYSTKADFLTAIATTNYDVVIFDLFFDDEAFTSSELDLIRYKANGGKRLLISYMSIGSAEKYRYYWKKYWFRQHPIWLKKRYEGYKDEYWVNFWNKDWQKIIYGNDESYTKKILNAGFDGVYLDNVEAYYFLYRKN